jgi:hypothetical protein
MYPSLILTELAAARSREAVDAAAAHRIVRQTHEARRAERRRGTTPSTRRIWIRTRTQPAPC